MQPAMTPAAGDGSASGAKKESLRERAFDEFRAYVVIAVYLWLLFATFSLHKQLLLHEHGFRLWQQGFAIINALVFGKVVLIADAMKLGGGLRRLPLGWVVLGRSLLFAVVLILFHIGEEALRGWFEGQSLWGGVADFGGNAVGLATNVFIFFVALIPFFAFQEAARVLGRQEVWDLFFGDGESYRLTKSG